MIDTDTETLLAANREFYRSFAAQDAAAMAQHWARRTIILCTHPGVPPQVGHGAVMDGWRTLFRCKTTRDIRYRSEQAVLLGDTAIVLCVEELPGGQLAASNVFVREDGEWRLIHHHVSKIFPETGQPFTLGLPVR
jgi:ketosteroid isomerase-like protein